MRRKGPLPKMKAHQATKTSSQKLRRWVIFGYGTQLDFDDGNFFKTMGW